LTRPDVRHLMLIGAYRDNEVNSTHPLMRKLEAIRQGGAIVHEVILAPLAVLSSRAANRVELATVACLRVDLYTTLDQSDRAVAVCLDYLRHLGVEWAPHPTEEEARCEYERIWSQLGRVRQAIVGGGSV
jgi:hypothetical protein